ncbi:MAG TPA: ABC transporter ATP-binding protein [Verrucomicrobiae bacterium]|nr:ABC transporter ATP-binding protein [Verrucomicrobiae bacterium]
MRKFRRLLAYAAPHRQAFGVIGLLTFLASVLAALQPWPLKLLVDHVLRSKPVPAVFQTVFRAFHLSPTPSALLIVIVLAGLVLFALNSVVELVVTRGWTARGRRMVFDVAEDLFARLQRRSLLFHARTPVGDTMGRINTDSWCVYQVLDTLVFAPGHALLTIGLMVFLMLQLDVTLTLIALAIAPFMVVASFLLGKPLRAAARLKREIESRLQAHIHQTLTGIPVVQAFAQEQREQERFRQHADSAIAAQQRATFLGSINSLSTGLVTTLGTGVILAVGARHVLDKQLDGVGSLLVFVAYLAALQTQMKTFAGVFAALQGQSASIDRVLEVLDAPPEVADKPGIVPPEAVHGHVQFDHVAFGYEPGRPVLLDVSFQVRPGQAVAIVGPTGAGKSTLVNLLPRFFDPTEGRVLLNGRDLRDLPLHHLRAHVALVMQEPFLFPFTVAENIAFGRPDAPRAEIEAAARAANAHDFIEKLPKGYDTPLGQRGATLSGGERQRLSIARALLKNAPILILDEPTSALDAETEQSVMQAIERLMRGRTTFIIAHRLSTVRRADVILVLKDGQIAESGTHDELLARGQTYARLHHTQFRSRDPEPSMARK